VELFDSFIKLTHDPAGTPTVLLNYGDALYGEPVIDGSQLTEPVALIRAAGIIVIPRANERNTLRYTLCTVAETLTDAFAGRLTRAIALPRTMADIKIEMPVADGRKWLLKNACITAWPGGQQETLTREEIQIQGGELVTAS